MPEENVTCFTWPTAEASPLPVELEKVLAQEGAAALTWVDVVHPTKTTLEGLAALHGLHPLAIEDCLHGFQGAKVIDYETHLFLVWHVLKVGHKRNHRGSRSELDIFVGRDFVITVAQGPLDPVEEVRELVTHSEGLRRGRPDWLLHALLDTTVDGYFPAIDAITADSDRLEEVMFADPHKKELQDLFDVKHRLIHVRHSIAPERDAMAFLARRESALIGRDTFPYFQDVYDHLSRLIDTIDITRDILQGALDIYLSSVSNRLNEVMKQLTVVATIAMPVTVVSSFFGMNFGWMVRNVASPWAFLGALAVMVMLASGLYVYIRGKGW